jgi:exopolysaccharide transport family protein
MQTRLRTSVRLDRLRPAWAGDPQALLALARRRLRWFAGVGGAAFAVVLVATALTPPRYAATAQVMLDPRREKVTAIDDVLSGLPADSAVVDTEAEVLKSRALAERVVAGLALERDPEFNPELRPGLFAPTPAATAPERRKRHDRLIDGVLRRLKVRRAGLTYLIEVRFESASPHKAARIADAFADRYIEAQLDARFEATRKANKWLNGRLVRLRAEVQAAEAAVERYKTDNGLMSAQGATLTEQEISSLNQQVALGRVQQAESEARLQTARRQLAEGSTGEDVGEALGSEVVRDLRRQRAEVSRKAAELQSRYGPRHPEVLKTEGELADIDRQIQAEIRRIISNLEAQARIQRDRTGALAGSLARSRGALASNNRAAVRLRELERDAESVRTLYESFLNRFRETSAQDGVEQSDVRVVSRAQVPSAPSAPNLGLNLVLGLMLALGSGAGAAVLREAFDPGLGAAAEIEQALGVPCLAGVPTPASTLTHKSARVPPPPPAKFVVDSPFSGFAEAFRSLRAALQRADPGGTGRVVAITSSLPAEGKTTTAVCLARAAAMAGDRVVVVDCDLRRRGLAGLIGAEPVVGLLEVLAGTATLEQALRIDTATGAALLPLARGAAGVRDVFGGPALDALLLGLRRRYDLVLLDAAPVLAVAETRTLARKADATVLLVRWRRTPRQAAEAALKLLQDDGAMVAGAVLSQIDLREQARSGYGDPGRHYRAYRSYYAG